MDYNFKKLANFFKFFLCFVEKLLKRGVSNGLCEHLRACEHCVYFCEHEQLSNFSCEQRAVSTLEKYRWRQRAL